MKIGIFDPYLDTLSGGEKYMLTLASCLASKHNVAIFWNPAEENEIKIKAKEKLGIDIANVSFKDNIFTGKFLPKILDTRKYDLIIYLSDGSIPLVSSKLIVHFQFPVEWVGNNIKTRLKLARVSKVICNSKFTKTYIDRKFNINSSVLYPPVEIKAKKTVKENLILHVGRFGRDLEGVNFKRQDFMIKSFNKLKEKGWRLVLVIGVREEDKKMLDSLKKMIKGNTEIIENPKNSELWDLYSKAKIYWHASGFGIDLQKYPEKAEHFGISTVEAMGAGAVPVVINAGGQKEIVEESLSGFLWNTEEEFIRKTEELIGDSILWDKMSMEAVKRSKKFSGERFCEEVNSLI